MRVAGSRGCKANMGIQMKQINLTSTSKGEKGNWAEPDNDLRRHLSAA